MLGKMLWTSAKLYSLELALCSAPNFPYYYITLFGCLLLKCLICGYSFSLGYERGESVFTVLQVLLYHRDLAVLSVVDDRVILQ